MPSPTTAPCPPTWGRSTISARLPLSCAGRGISLCLDLVLNHVAREHPWAVAAREGDERYRRYFHIFPDRSTPDAYERTLPEVFPDFAPGNFTWDDEVAGWVWTTFNEWQWDVDWSNPDVVCEYADVILFFANLGVEVLRLDAIAFIWKRLGTTSQNEPEVHAITQTLRALAHLACPAVEFKAEAIVSPSDVVHYLGRGARWGKVSDLAYHNSLMVHIWSMLASRDVRLSVHALRAIGEVPSTTAWITYARCHDDIGWAIDDVDAAAVYLSGPAHRAFLSDYYSGDFWQSPARGLVFQHNEVTGDRRISGMLASLAGLDAALERADGHRFADGRSTPRSPASCWSTPSCSVGAGCRSSGWVTRSACATIRRGPTSPPTPRTTGGCTVPACRGTWPSAGTRRGRSSNGCSPAWCTSPGSGPGCPVRMRPSLPSRSNRAIPACWWCCGATPLARCSVSTTSPTPSARSQAGGWRPSGWSQR